MLRKRHAFLSVLILLAAFAAAAQEQTPVPAAGPTLSSILARREVICGVDQDLPGFGYLDPNLGEVRGFAIDLCRALGAAIFGDTAAARPVFFFSRDESLNALRSAQVDVLFQAIPWSLTLDSSDLNFGSIYFHNGQTLMTRAGGGLEAWEDLDGRTICAPANAGNRTALDRAMSRRGLSYEFLEVESDSAALQALLDGRCDAVTGDRLQLEVQRLRSADPTLVTVWNQIDQVFTREPFTPITRDGDPQWSDLVNWMVLGLIQAEEAGVTSENVAELSRASGETDEAYLARVGVEIARLLDVTLGSADSFGLPPTYMATVIAEVGNYGEIFDRYFGLAGDLPLERSLNRSWLNGGLLFAPDWQ